MQAALEDQQIECIWSNGDWVTCNNPIWDWCKYYYRIKPEQPKPKYRPFESAEEVMEAIKEHGVWVRTKDGTYTAIINVLEDRLFLGESISSRSYNYMLKENYTFADGTPFGKLIKE